MKFLKDNLHVLKKDFQEYWALIKEQGYSIFFLLAIGIVNIPLWMKYPDSEIGHASSEVANSIFNGLDLTKVFLLITSLFLSLSSIVKVFDSTNSMVERSADVALKGMSTFFVPIATYGLLLSIFMLISLFSYPEERLLILGITNKQTFSLMFTSILIIIFPILIVFIKRLILETNTKIESVILMLGITLYGIFYLVWSI